MLDGFEKNVPAEVDRICDLLGVPSLAVAGYVLAGNCETVIIVLPFS